MEAPKGCGLSPYRQAQVMHRHFRLAVDSPLLDPPLLSVLLPYLLRTITVALKLASLSDLVLTESPLRQLVLDFPPLIRILDIRPFIRLGR
jgi:hypothetical protein